MKKSSGHITESENIMVEMIALLIGIIMVRIIVEFVKNKTSNSKNICKIFKKIKMSGLKFDLLCRGIALGLVVIFYLLHLMGISNVLPYAYIVFIYMEVLMLFIAPLKTEVEYNLLIKEVPEEIFGYKYLDNQRIECEKAIIMLSSINEICLVVMLYIKIVNHNFNVFVELSPFIFFSLLIFDIPLSYFKIWHNKRFKRLEVQYYEEKFRSYYRK